MTQTRHAAPAVKSRRQWAALLLLAFTGPVVLSFLPVIYDDPFILLRYAQHLTDGTGWQFNPTLPTENAVTSPLYVLILALGGGSVVWSAILYALAWGLGGFVLAQVLWFDGHQKAGWIGCGLYSISALLANVRGMETALYLLLILAATWGVQQQKWLLVGCLLGLLAMNRTDGILVGAVVLAWILWRHRQALLKVAAPFVAITAAWTLVLWWITGSLFPSTLASKTAQRDSGVVDQWGFLRFLNVNGVAGASDPSAMQVIVLGWLSLIILAAAVVGTVAARTRTAIPLLAGVAAVVVIVYGLVFRMMPWYLWHYAPFTLWTIAAAAVGVEVMLRRNRISAVVIVVAVAATLIGIRTEPIPDRSHYRAAAEWIDRDSTAPNPTVATAEIGTIGYYSRADIIDYMGLLDHRAIEAVRRGDLTWWLSQHPDYWVTSSSVAAWDAETLNNVEFQRNYRPVAYFGSLTIYRATETG